MTSRNASSIAGSAARIASVLGPRVMRVIAQVNRFVTNPILKLWAPRLRHMARHREPRPQLRQELPDSGDGFRENGSLSVVLNYGEQSDWVRNVTTAGSALVVNQGKRYTLSTSPLWGPGCEPSQNAGSALWPVPRNSDATGSIAGGGVAPWSWWVKAGVGEVERISDTV